MKAVQNIYVTRRALFRSLALYVFSLVFWLVLLAFIFNPKNFKIHPDLSPIVWICLFTLFAIIAVGTVFVLCRGVIRCAIEMIADRKLVYTISTHGVVDHRSGQTFAWENLKPFRLSAKGYEFVAPTVEGGANLIIEKRGLSPTEYRKLVEALLLYAPSKVTERTGFR